MKYEQIITDFFKFNKFESVLNLRELWFFNGQDPKWKIRFLRDELYECFSIKLYKEGSEICSSNDTGLYHKWDLCLIELFGSRFSIQRKGNSFLVSSKSYFQTNNKSEDAYNSERQIEIVKTVSTTSEEIRSFNKHGKCSYISLGNKRIEILQAEYLLEPTACRFMLLYVLAKSYYYCLESYAHRISDEIFSSPKKLTNVVNILPFKLGKSQKIEEIYSDCILFESKYLFTVPLNITRVQDLSDIWDDLSDYYKIKALNDEMISKINSLTLLIRTKHATMLSSYMTTFAIIGVFVSVLKIVELVRSFF
ncbi:MAG: hypothetical protein ACI4NE_07475 [Succinivibrio sp.]